MSFCGNGLPQEDLGYKKSVLTRVSSADAKSKLHSQLRSLLQACAPAEAAA